MANNNNNNNNRKKNRNGFRMQLLSDNNVVLIECTNYESEVFVPKIRNGHIILENIVPSRRHNATNQTPNFTNRSSIKGILGQSNGEMAVKRTISECNNNQSISKDVNCFSKIDDGSTRTSKQSSPMKPSKATNLPQRGNVVVNDTESRATSPDNPPLSGHFCHRKNNSLNNESIARPTPIMKKTESQLFNELVENLSDKYLSNTKPNAKINKHRKEGKKNVLVYEKKVSFANTNGKNLPKKFKSDKIIEKNIIGSPLTFETISSITNNGNYKVKLKRM